jgi:hypothetical protein
MVKKSLTSDRLIDNILLESVVFKGQPLYSAFHTKSTRIKLDSNHKTSIVVNYLPIQMLSKHTALIIFSNDAIGEFIYYLEGTPLRPDTFKVTVDEQFLDTDKCRFIKTQSINKTISGVSLAH